MREGWPLAFAYCAFLAIASIGLIRLGRRAFLLIGVPFAVAIIPGIVGVALMLQSSGSLDSGGSWLQISVYLLYAFGAWGIYWIVRGWLLYYSNSSLGV